MQGRAPPIEIDCSGRPVQSRTPIPVVAPEHHLRLAFCNVLHSLRCTLIMTNREGEHNIRVGNGTQRRRQRSITGTVQTDKIYTGKQWADKQCFDRQCADANSLQTDSTRR